MRLRLFCVALLSIFVFALALPAHADPMNEFTVIVGGTTVDFSLPASTTQVCLTCLGNSNDQFNFGSVPGTVNNVSEPIGVNFIIGSGCAECDTILFAYPSASWTIFLPPLDAITVTGTFPNQDATLTFIPGDYMTTGFDNQFNFQDFEIKVSPEATPTPEPPTFFLFAAAALGGGLLIRRRPLGQRPF